MRSIIQKIQLSIYKKFNNDPVMTDTKKVYRMIKSNNTPLFVIDKARVRENIWRFNVATKKYYTPSITAYSFKTNTDVIKTQCIRPQESWAEVVSSKEYALAKHYGFKGKHIVFNGPYKSNTDISTALHDKTKLHIDNYEEFSRVLALSKKLKKPANIGIRINSYTQAEKSRFGFHYASSALNRIVSAIKNSKLLNISGLHMHIGTDIYSVRTYTRACMNMARTVEITQAQLGSLEYIDVGGGFPSLSYPPYKRIPFIVPKLDSYIRTITTTLLHVLKDNSLDLLYEPGRIIVDDAVVFVARVINTETTSSKQLITIDGTVTMLPLVYYRPQNIKIIGSHGGEKTQLPQSTIVYGASCKEDDVLFRGVLPHIQHGDYVVFTHAGAYNQTMGSSFMFDLPTVCVA